VLNLLIIFSIRQHLTAL